ncbi:MAG: proprotein convertase P-domain-containing protein [Crocinitomicaceae bacterium]|nr:proprotein convertase P-domain-containing protein [Crocinitomicaceae bacterium]
MTIPAGQLSVTVFINSVSDGIPEGQETIYIIYQPDACSPVDTALLYIDDAQPIEFTIDGTDLDCYDDNTGEILVNATGGFPTYTYHVTTNGGTGTTTTHTTNPITGLAAGTYSVQVYDIYGCKADALVIGGVFDADTTFLPDGTGVSYTTTININGFGAGELLDDMSQLQQICATMEHSYLGDLQIKVISPSGQEVILKEFSGGGSCDLGEPFASGPVDGANSTLTDPGVGYEYCWNDAPVFGTMVAESGNFSHTIPASTGGTYTDNYLPQGSYTSFGNLNSLLGSTLDGDWVLEVSDQFGLDNGYIFNWNISLVSDLPDTLVTLNQPTETTVSGFITQAQCGTNDGAINISVAGDYPPYTFLWSNGAITEDLSAIGAGTYEVFVTNANGCTDSAEFILNNISSLNISTSITSVTCAGGNNGAIAVTTSGGTAPYTYSWSNGASTEDLSSITANTYTITITDDNGCIYSEDLVVSTLPSMVIVANNVTNEACGTSNGSIDISVSGGSGSYGYSWSNGMMTQDISSLSAGLYTIDVTDGFGCVSTQNITLINDVSNCSAYCFLDAVVNSITDEICGNGTGAIDISVVDATQPYTLSWSTGSTNEDLSNLSAGTYSITINDANQCEHIETFTVGNTTSGLGISASSVSDENCGNGLGAIDISVSGGTLPYTYNWSTGATSQDLTNLTTGSYSVTVTDGNGCQFVQNFSITNNTGSLAYSTVVTNELCNNNNGNINLTVTGASGSLTYSCSNGVISQDISGLNPGIFTCTIID